MSAGQYAAGAAFFLVTVGASAVTAALALRRLPDLDGAARWLAAAVIFTAALIAAHMLPGVLGVLTRGTVAAVAVAGTGAAWAFTRGASPERRTSASAAGDGRPTVARALAVLAGGATAACVVGYFRTEATRSVTSADMLNFHLPLLASWIQSGSFWAVVDFLPYDTTGNYPQNGDVLMLASVLPWRGDAFARFAVLPYVAMAGLATYALGRELRADRARAALTACVVVATPIVLLAGVASALPDVVMYGTFGAGLVFLVRCARTRRSSDALLAGIGLGIAFGTKWYAVPAVGAIVVLFAVGLLAERADWRQVARRAGVVVAAIALAGGFWLVRNAVESGSPFFPAGWLPVGARSDVGSPTARTDFPLVHYLFDGDVLRRVILPDELRAFGLGGIVLLVGALAVAALAIVLARRGERGLRPVVWTLVAAALLAVVYVVTPNTASGFEGDPVLVFYSARYLVPAAIPAAAALAWAATRLGRWGVVIDVLAALAVADGLRRAFDLPAGRLAAGVLAVALVVALAWVGARVPRRGLAVAGAAALLVAVAGGYALERRYSDHRMRGQDATLDYFIAHSREGDRVGITEQWSVQPPSPVYAMFGERLRNRVDYAGEFDEGVNKPYRDPARFADAMRRGRFDWLIVGRGRPPGQTTPAMRWAAASGYRQVALTERLALYRRVAQP